MNNLDLSKRDAVFVHNSNTIEFYVLDVDMIVVCVMSRDTSLFYGVGVLVSLALLPGFDHDQCPVCPSVCCQGVGGCTFDSCLKPLSRVFLAILT